MFEISHINSAGVAERQTVTRDQVLSLINKIGRLGGIDISVMGANREQWTAEEAAAYFGGAPLRTNAG